MRYGGERNMRRYYSTSDVSQETGLDVSQLMRLEKMFPNTRPLRSKTGRKLYRENELIVLQRLAELLKSGVAWEELALRLDAPPLLRDLLQPLREELLEALHLAKGEQV